MKKVIKGASAAAVIALGTLGIPPAHATGGIIQLVSVGAIPGFSVDTCGPSANLSPNGIETVDCVNNTMPGGPPFARVVQFAEQSTLNNDFEADARSTALQPCPGSSDAAPTTWNATNPPPASGSVMCYTSNDNTAHVEWTNTAVLLKVDASGPDMATLYGWWHGLVTAP